MPVHILYMTAWVDEAGVLGFGDDVYDLDPALEAMLSRSREERAALTKAAADDTGDRER
jgi:murein L,D-transpeptidase YcbB/YkuD